MIEFQNKYHGGFANNFDCIRLILATSVVFLHFDHLVNDPAVSAVLRYTKFLSGHAVEAFFVVSGFVVFMSYDRARDLRSYVVSRLFRLYPVYLAAILLVGSLPFLLSSCTDQDLFSSAWFKYLAANLMFLNFLQPSLPCVFDANFDKALNGSLWTIKIEVMFYAIVPVLFFLVRRFGGVFILTLTYILSWLYSLGMMKLAERSGSDFYTTLAYQLPGQMTYFSAGVFLYLYYEHFAANQAWLLPLSALLLVFQFPGVAPIALGIIVIAVAVTPKYHVDLTKLGDLSYGVYVFHFPIIQLFLQMHLFEKSRVGLFFAVLAATFFVAFLSSRLIEKPAANLKKRLSVKQAVRLKC